MKRILGVFLLILAVTANAIAQDMMQEGLALKYLVQLPTEKSAHPPIIILLHGYGSDEKDLFALRTFFPKNYIIVSARAPYPITGSGYEWYEMTDVNGIHDGNVSQLANSKTLIEKFVKQVVSAYHADEAHVYLMGFSQGAIMSYRVGLTDPSLLKGIGVLSGTIYPSLKPMVKKTAALKQLRIFIAHGEIDERISFADGQGSSDYLKTLGLNPEFHSYAGMGHTISRDVLSDLVKWLK
jgi:phospholipase/carboxylesterase